MFTFLQQLVRDLEPADIADIVVLSLLLYVAVSWMLRTRSRAMVVLVAAFGLISFLAHHFELYLTSILLSTVSTVVLIALAVIFQADLCRGYARLEAWWRGYGRGATLPHDPHVDTLVHVALEAAAKKIGLLLVLSGRDPVEHLLHGGIFVSAPVDRGLLLSIFDPNTPGHDGAAVIEAGRITHLGAHLPLSTSAAGAGFGTRHSAALGLCEASDALVLVVSEERGEISLAAAGRLETLKSGAELRERLDSYLQERVHPPQRSSPGRRTARRALVAAVSLLLGMTSWVALTDHPGQVMRTFVVPIEYSGAPAGLHLAGDVPGNVRVLLIGSKRAFRLLRQDDLLISAPLRNVHPGPNEVRLRARDVVHPPELQVYAVEPDSLRLQFATDGHPA